MKHKIFERIVNSRTGKIQACEKTKNGFWFIRQTFKFVVGHKRSRAVAISKAKALFKQREATQ